MLKWAVNCPRQTYLENDKNVEFPVIPASSTHEQQRKRIKRTSSDLGNQQRSSWLDKENQYTSTPLQTSNKNLLLESSSIKMGSFKDLSNIGPPAPLSFNSPLRVSAKTLKAPESIQSRKNLPNLPNNYATTLPTFDVEYSPCALVPGPILALRGVGIPDSYFEKPRYITPHPKDDGEENDEMLLEAKTIRKPVKSILKYPTHMEESTLSSSKMGDATLERMIDAILESNQKERRPQKHIQQQNSNMSPTYTPAEDPASDLHEFWDSEKARYRQKEQKFRAKLTKRSLFNEREISASQSQECSDVGQLRRQGGLRRKRKIIQITASVMSSAQKLLGKSTPIPTQDMYSHNPHKFQETKVVQDEIYPRKLFRNLSPDSGHNSSSDCEQGEDNSTLERPTGYCKTSGNIKR